MLAPTHPSLRALLLALGLGIISLSAVTHSLPAHAQEDDDDDDGSDDDDDDDAGGSGWSSDDDDDDNGGIFGFSGGNVLFPRQQSTPRPPSQPVVLPQQSDDQLVVDRLGTTERAALMAAGYTVLEERSGRLLLQLPDDMTVEGALEQVQDLAPTALAAPNSYYRSQAVPESCEGALCGHWEAVSWPPAALDPLCQFEPHIGVIDTGVNLDHAMLSNARLTLESIGSDGLEPSEHKHGTAVVTLFVGNPADRVPGLAPAAELLVIDPFARDGEDERSDVFALIDALDRLAAAGVDVASLSLAGPDNRLLAEAISRLQSAGIPVVAAVGNAGARSEPLYPAAYQDVVAVTAVDAGANIYRRAVQGDHVSFSAPGVEIATAASISGVRPQTGTSFAVPFVTTALAAAMANGASPADAVAALAASSVDLGTAGRDSVFGWGMVQIPSPC